MQREGGAAPDELLGQTELIRSTHSSGVIRSGYLKDYNYDDRLRYRSPPYFLNPVDAAWRAVKVTEQVPATQPLS